MFHSTYQPHFVFQLPGQHHPNHPNHSNFNDSRQIHHRPPFEVFQMMGYDLAPVRHRQYWPLPRNHRWREYDMLMPPPSPALNSRYGNKIIKPGMNHWNHHSNNSNHSTHSNPSNNSNHFSNNHNYKPSNHVVRLNQSQSNNNRGDDSSDSGVSSRSPTPNNCHHTSNNEIDRLDNSSEDSISSDSCKDNKRSHEVSKPSPNLIRNSGLKFNSSSNNHQYHNNHHPVHRSNSTSVLPSNYHQGQPKKHIFIQYNSSQHNSRPPPGRKVANIPFHTPPPIVSKSPISYYSPDRFLARSHLMEITDTPTQLIARNEWDKLSQAIWEKFVFNQQSEELYRRKVSFWKVIFHCIKRPPFLETIKKDAIKKQFPHYGLCLVGSTMTGFGSNKSDIDMCLVVHHTEIDQRNEAVHHLGDLLEYLQQFHFLEKLELIHAKVPILKFRVVKQGIDVDLNCNNAVGIRNTHLLYCYAQADWRVRPLVMIIKLWAHYHNINDAKNMTISSYSLSLMVIHFLQCGVTPQVLPCLHRLFPGKFSPHTDISQVDLHEDLPPYKSENKMTLGELLLRFFQYYDSFDFNQFAISVRLGCRIPVEECRKARSLKSEPHSWKYLCIEEPFDLTNTARSVYDPEVFEQIKNIINLSCKRLKKTISLDSIFRFHLYK